MRIEKDFIPISIVLETKKDFDFIIQIITNSERYYMTSGHSYEKPRKSNDDFMVQCRELKLSIT